MVEAVSEQGVLSLDIQEISSLTEELEQYQALYRRNGGWAPAQERRIREIHRLLEANV